MTSAEFSCLALIITRLSVCDASAPATVPAGLLRQVLMQQRVAAIEEREQQRRIRMESLGQQATTAGGPDVSRFTSQLENRGYAAADSSKAGGQAGAAGRASGGAGGQGAAGSGSSTGQGS